MKKFKLVPYWHSWHRMHSIRWSGLAIACAGALKGYNYEMGVSPSIVSGIPHWVPTLLLWGTIVGPLLAAGGALIQQDNIVEESKENVLPNSLDQH